MRCAVRRKKKTPARPQRVGSTRPRHESTSPSSPTSCCGGARRIRRDHTPWLYFCAITLGGWRPASKDYPTMTETPTEVRFHSFTWLVFFCFVFNFLGRGHICPPETQPLPETCVAPGLCVKTSPIQREAEGFRGAGGRGGEAVFTLRVWKMSADADPSAQSASAHLMTVTLAPPSSSSRRKTRASLTHSSD